MHKAPEASAPSVAVRCVAAHLRYKHSHCEISSTYPLIIIYNRAMAICKAPHASIGARQLDRPPNEDVATAREEVKVRSSQHKHILCVEISQVQPLGRGAQEMGPPAVSCWSFVASIITGAPTSTWHAIDASSGPVVIGGQGSGRDRTRIVD